MEVQEQAGAGGRGSNREAERCRQTGERQEEVGKAGKGKKTGRLLLLLLAQAELLVEVGLA